MAKRKVKPEFYWDEKKNLYRKRFVGADGKTHDAYGRTMELCREKKAAMEAEINLKMLPALPDVLVYEYAARWFILNTEGLKPSTRARYKTNIENHICPVIGQMPIKSVKRDDVLAVLHACSHLSRATQAKVLSVMRQIFESAEASDLIEKTPVRNIKPFGAAAVGREALTKEQQAALLSAVEGTGAETFVRLCLFAGLRREEALGLCWDSVELDAEVPFLRVCRAVNWHPSSGAPVLTTELKSKAARRDVPLPPALADHLRTLKRGSGPIVCNKQGGPMSKQSFRRLWGIIEARTAGERTVVRKGKKVKVRYNVGDRIKNHSVEISLDFPCTPHQLRHTYISELVLSGANVKTVQYLAGHSSVRLTLDIYTHLMANRPEDTFAAVAAAFSQQGSDGGKKTAPEQSEA